MGTKHVPDMAGNTHPNTKDQDGPCQQARSSSDGYTKLQTQAVEGWGESSNRHIGEKSEAADTQESYVLLPRRPIQWIVRILRRLWHKDDIRVFQMGNGIMGIFYVALSARLGRSNSIILTVDELYRAFCVVETVKRT